MSLWLLLKKGEQQAQTLALQEVGRTIGPPQKKFDVVLKPDLNDSLFRSAEVGGGAAYDLLWKEGYIRTTATGRFRFDNVPPHINGKSADLLFALAFIIATMPRREAYPPLAATGIIGKKGDVLSVGSVPAKLLAALEVLPESGIIFYPRANQGEINAELIAAAENQNIELFPVENLNQAADRLGIVIRQVYLKEPYRGLHTFEYEHRAIYFGRDQEIEKLRDRLINREVMNTPGILIIAASGAGKSSLVRAGLIPALEQGPNALPERPIIWAAWRPGDASNKDEAALAHSVRTAWQGQPGSMAFFSNVAATETLAELVEQLKHALPPDRRFLWLIDQFEEFFTAGFDNEALKSFADFLKALQKSGVWIVATLRGDFYGQYLQFPFLNCFGDNGIFNLGPLDKTALGQIIRGPAELVDNLDWERDENGVSLADRLLQDMGEKVDALPLLEFSLDNLYQMRRQVKQKADKQEEDSPWQMCHASYEESGRLMGSIGRYAETIFNNDKLKQEARDSLYRLLWALTAADENHGDQQIAARPLRLNDFPKGDPVRDLIDVFTDERLLVQDRQEDNDGDIQVRVAHDALLNHWERAKVIIDGFLADKQLHERLKVQAKDWRSALSNDTQSYLLSDGPLLVRAEDLLVEGMRNLLDTDVVDWLAASRQAVLQYQATEREHLQMELIRQRKQARRSKIAASVMLGLTIFAASGGYLAYQLQQQADRHRRETEELLSFMMFDLYDKLKTLNRLDLLETIARRAARHYETNFVGVDMHTRSAVLHNIGVVLADQGDANGALQNFRLSLMIRKKLVSQDPTNTDWQRELFVSHIHIGNTLLKQGDQPGSLQSLRAGHVIAKKLTSQDSKYDLLLWKSHFAIGEVMRRQGNLTSSLQNFQESLTSLEKHADLVITDVGLQRDVLIIHAGIGDILTTQDDLPGALQHYQTSLTMIEKLTAQFPTSILFKTILPGIQERVGNVLFAQGDLSGALQNHYASLEIRKKLTDHDPDNGDWQRDLSISYNSIGNILKKQGDLLNALQNLRKGNDIYKKLVVKNPENLDWENRLATSHGKIGDLLRKQGDLTGAMQNYKASLTIGEKLTQQNSSNLEWQADVAKIHEGLGILFRLQNDNQTALYEFQQGAAIMANLVATSPKHVAWSKILERIKNHIAEIVE